jgi:hypothetical protein
MQDYMGQKTKHGKSHNPVFKSASISLPHKTDYWV